MYRNNMFSYCLFRLLSSNLLYTEAHFLHSNEAINKNINNKKELINIIQSLNRLNENLIDNNEEYKKVLSKEELTDMEKEQKLQQLLWLIKNNYKAQKQYDLVRNPAHSGARLYFIRNPNAIDEYKHYLERKKTRPKKQNIKNKLQELRRNVMFRTDEGENKEESNENSDIDKNSDNSGLNTEDNSLQDKEDHQNRHRETVEDKKLYSNDNVKESYEKPISERKPPVDSMEIHNKVVHASERSNVNLRREKMDRDAKNDRGDEKNLNWDPKDNEYDLIKPEKKHASSKHVNLDKINSNSDKISDKFENYRETSKRSKKTYDSVKVAKFTTKNEFHRKIVNDKPKYRPKISYKKPKSYVRHRNDYSLHGTSIPYIGKKGIYEDD